MSLEAIIASNYDEFAKRRKSNWLLFAGIVLIAFGVVLNLLYNPSKKIQNTTDKKLVKKK